jgi:hypothetical protein
VTQPVAEYGNRWFSDDDEEVEEELGETDGEGEDANEGEESSNDLEPALKAQLEKLFAERETALAKSIEEGDQNNGVYKGLQRSMASKDRKIQELEATVTRASQVIEEIAGRIDGQGDISEWLKETVLDALGEDDRKIADGKLQERTLNRSRAQLDAAKARAQAPQSQAAPGDDEQFQALIRERMAQFVTGRESTAKLFGVDPKDARLDYGKDDEGLIERTAKFDASLAKLLKEDQDGEETVNRVRPKTNRPATRSSGGGNAPASSSGASRLEQGADEYLRKIRRGY